MFFILKVVAIAKIGKFAGLSPHWTKHLILIFVLKDPHFSLKTAALCVWFGMQSISGRNPPSTGYLLKICKESIELVSDKIFSIHVIFRPSTGITEKFISYLERWWGHKIVQKLDNLHSVETRLRSRVLLGESCVSLQLVVVKSVIHCWVCSWQVNTENSFKKIQVNLSIKYSSLFGMKGNQISEQYNRIGVI